MEHASGTDELNPSAGSTLTAPGTPLRVLVADDERVPRTLLARQVSQWGYPVEEAESGIAAWAMLDRPNPPRIAIVDWMMPDLDGMEICRRLRDRPDGPLIYTILLTSRTDEASLVHALEQGAHDFQTKPARAAELRARLLVGRRLVEADDRLSESLARTALLASTDALTGIANRRHFFELAEREVSRSQRNGTPIAVMLIDIDYFKDINDSHGHAAGDAALRHLATQCTARLRCTDVIGRFGGDEFVALLPDCDPPTALATAERLAQAVHAQPVVDAAQSFRITISVGLALNSPGKQSQPGLDTLLRRADQALYRAKTGGRNKVVVSGAESAA